MHYFILRVYSKFMPMLFDVTPYRPRFFNHVFAEMTWDMGPNRMTCMTSLTLSERFDT